MSVILEVPCPLGCGAAVDVILTPTGEDRYAAPNLIETVSQHIIDVHEQPVSGT